jgi:hypothetical protein
VLGFSADSIRHFHQRALRALRTRFSGAALVIALIGHDVLGDLLAGLSAVAT